MSTPPLPGPLLSPSEAAALGVIDSLPPDHWERWSARCAARIRAQPTPCVCGPFSAPDGARCGRCFGTVLP